MAGSYRQSSSSMRIPAGQVELMLDQLKQRPASR